MKRSRLFKHSLLVRLLGLLMVFLFLSAFTAPEKPEYGIYDPDHYLTDETISQIWELNNVNSKKSEKFQMGVLRCEKPRWRNNRNSPPMKQLELGRLATRETKTRLDCGCC